MTIEKHINGSMKIQNKTQKYLLGGIMDIKLQACQIDQ